MIITQILFQLFIKNRSVGYISLHSVGTFHKPIYKASITPVFGASLLDRTALKMWCEKSVIEAAHTLFVQYEIVEENPIHLLAAA